jgi:hypothetical protein
VPISQPIITDGFGHADFYALAGLYTVVVAIGGAIQQVYPDQSLGGVGTGSGVVPLALQVNGTPNSSQTLLNLESTDSSIVITDLGGGNIDLQSGESSAIGNILFSDGSINLPYIENSAVDAAGGNGISDQLNGILITVPVAVVISHVAFVPVVGAGSRNVSFAFYSKDGNTKVLDTGAIVFTGGSGVVLTAPLGPVTLTPGNYWFMQTGNPASGVACTGWVARYTPQTPGSEQMCDMYTLTANRLVFAANPRVGGVMPATLGALTPQTHVTAAGIIQAMFY